MNGYRLGTRNRGNGRNRAVVFGFFAVAWMLPAVRAAAHCDTMDGPVVTEARQALAAGNVTPVLKWVAPPDEAAIREAFQKTVAVRTKGPEAQALADQWFFETLVRVHRAAEGAPFTGLEPAGTEAEPGIRAADESLQSGSADAVVKDVQKAADAGIRERYERVMKAKAHAKESVEAGRAFVAAYVEYIHYVEGVHQAISGAGAAHEHSGAAAKEHSEAAHEPSAPSAHEHPAAPAKEHSEEASAQEHKH